MSTTFGILQTKVEHEKLVDEDGDLLNYISHEIFEPIFFRGTNSRWLRWYAENLDDNIKVYALDNTNQGIFTIKDCKEFLKKKENDCLQT
jgi:hypothetical protein